jgi:hypothetical protein
VHGSASNLGLIHAAMLPWPLRLVTRITDNPSTLLDIVESSLEVAAAFDSEANRRIRATTCLDSLAPSER